MRLDLKQYGPLLSILAASLDGGVPARLPQGTEEWQFLFDSSCRHAVQGVVFDVIKDLPSGSGIPGTLAARWLIEVRRIEETNRRIEAVVTKQRSTWARLGINAILLKGMETARFYPCPEHRVNGDIDWWLPSDADWNAAIKVLKDNNIRWTVDSDGDIYYELGGILVEHHRAGHATPSATPESTLLLLSEHILHHALVNGAGLRQIYDYAAARKSLYASCDSMLYAKLLSERHLSRWNRVLEDLPASMDTAPRRFNASRRLLRLVLTDGNFGLDKQCRYSGLLNRTTLFLQIAPYPLFFRWAGLIKGRLTRSKTA